MISLLCTYISTWGIIGYLPASGTLATLTAMPLMYLVHRGLTETQYGLFCLAITMLSILIIHGAKDFNRFHKDPSQVVIDEVVGTFITFWEINLTWPTAIIGFIAFRIFDITKICGIDYAQRLPRPWGILCDDVLAALLANLVLRILFYAL